MNMSRRQRLQLVRGGIYALTIAALALLIISVDWGALGGALFKWDVVKKQFPDILTSALRNTIIFTIFGFIGGLSLGLLLAIMRLSKSRPYRWFAATYIEILRGFLSHFSYLVLVSLLPQAGAGPTLTYRAQFHLLLLPGHTLPKRFAQALRLCPAGKWKQRAHSACRTHAPW
jgi:polar amino acid transport system permease protein